MNNEVYKEIELEVISEYEEVLLGNQISIDKYYFAGRSAKTCNDIVLTLIRYVSETYWGWSPRKMFESINKDILKQWHLYSYLRYVQFPEDLNKERYLCYLAHLIYPDQIPLNSKDICLSVYKRLLDGEIQKYPKYFFSNENGADRVCYCLKYAIDNFLSFSSLEDLYAFFGSSKCLGFLRKYKLMPYIRDHFDAPVVALSSIVAQSQNIPFLVQFYRFHWIYREHRRLEVEKRGVKPTRIHSATKRKDDRRVQTDL